MSNRFTLHILFVKPSFFLESAKVLTGSWYEESGFLEFISLSLVESLILPDSVKMVDCSTGSDDAKT